MASAEHLTLKVPNISCEHCKLTIESVLGKESGVNNVQVNVERQTVQLSFDPAQTSQPRIEEVLADEEYPVSKE